MVYEPIPTETPAAAASLAVPETDAAIEVLPLADKMLVEEQAAETEGTATIDPEPPVEPPQKPPPTESNQDLAERLKATNDVVAELTGEAETSPIRANIEMESISSAQDDDFVVGQVLETVINNSSSQEQRFEGGLNDFLVYDDDDEAELLNSFKENRAVAVVEPNHDEIEMMNGVETLPADGVTLIGQDLGDQVYGRREAEKQDEEKEEEVYIVERILDKKIGTNGCIKYLVKWLNYPSKDNSWEPIDNLIDCSDAMIRFEFARAKKLARKHENDKDEDICLIDRDGLRNTGERRPIEYEVNDIMGLVKLKDERYFLTSLSNSTKKAFVRSTLANAIFPNKVIDFYIKNLKWDPQIEI